MGKRMAHGEREQDNDLSQHKRVKVVSEDAKILTSGKLDVETGQRSAFPTDSTGDFAEGDVPLNAFDYIASVRREAAKRPSFVHNGRTSYVVPKGRGPVRSYEEDSGPQTYSTVKSQTVQSSSLYPQPAETRYQLDLEWYAQFIENFRSCKLTIVDIPSCKPSVALPNTMAKWRVFMLDGQHPPTVSLVKSLSTGTMITLIGYQTKWLSTKINESLTQWIYSLLLCLPLILEGQDVAVLRDMAKKSIQIRTIPHKALDEMTAYTLDTIVSVVSGCYGQNDLVKLRQEALN